MASKTAIPTLPPQPPVIPRATKPGRNTPLPIYTTPPASRSSSPSQPTTAWPQGESLKASRPLDTNYCTVNGDNGHLFASTSNSNLDFPQDLAHDESGNTLAFPSPSQQQQTFHPYQPTAAARPVYLPSTVYPSQQPGQAALAPSSLPALASEVSNLSWDNTNSNTLSSPRLHPQYAPATTATTAKHAPAPLQLDQEGVYPQGHLLPPISPSRPLSLTSPTSSLFPRSRSPSPSPFSKRLSQSLSDGRLESSYHQIIDDQKYFTAFAQSTSQVEPILAIASAAKSNNKIYFYDYTSPRSCARSRVEPLTLRASLPHSSPVYSLAWSPNHLLTGGANGVVQLYQVDYAALSSPDPSQCLQLTNSFNTLQLNKLLELPGAYITATTRVNRVQFAPDSSLFLANAGSYISIWNVHQSQSPEHKCSLSSQAVHAAQFSPHADSFLYAFGGMDRQLRIMDRRQNSGDMEAMLLTDAHRGSIRDVQWNPFVPYWLASCGDDGQIKVWDLRFQSRAMVELGDYGQGFYQALAWSNSHCDIISSSSRDRAFQVWKLGVQWTSDEDEAHQGAATSARRSSRIRPLSSGHSAGASSSSSAATAVLTLEMAKKGTLRRSGLDISSLSITSSPLPALYQSHHLSPPHHHTNHSKASGGTPVSRHKTVIGSQVAMVKDISDASIAQILSSNQDPDTFLTLTSAGILATHALRPSTLDTLAPHRDPVSSFSREYEVERSLYRRDLTDVCHQLLDWVRSGEDDEGGKKSRAKRGHEDKEGKTTQKHSHINPREMLGMMTDLPPRRLSSQSWTLPSLSLPTTPASPSYPADQLQVPSPESTLTTRRRRFSAQIFSSDRSRSRSPSTSSVNSDAGSSLAPAARKLDPANLQAFVEAFEQYTLKELPPGFPLHLASQPLPADLDLQITNMAKHDQLLQLVRGHQAQDLVDRLGEIGDMAVRDPVNMDVASLCQILNCVMDWDHVQGLRMARTLIGLLMSSSSNLQQSTISTTAISTPVSMNSTSTSEDENARWWPLVHMALFPTVFDRSMVQCGPEAYEAYKAIRSSGRRQMLERFTLTFNESKRRSFTSLKTPVLQDFDLAQSHISRLGNHAAILDMLDFEIHMQSLLAHEPHSVPAHIVLELFHPTEYQGCKTTLSQQTMAIYFDATSMTGQWGDYFETLERLLRDYSCVMLDSQGQPNAWLASSIKSLEASAMISSLLAPPRNTFHNQGSPSSLSGDMVASPASMSNNSLSSSSSATSLHLSSQSPPPPSSPVEAPPALISHFLWAHFNRLGLPALRDQMDRVLYQPQQSLMQTPAIVLESWIMALGRLIKVWWGGDNKLMTPTAGDNGGHDNSYFSRDGGITLIAAALGGAPMAKVVLVRRQLEFQFDTIAGRFFQRISIGPNNPEQTRENAERQANALMDQLRSNGLLKRKHQNENPVPEADRLYQALLGFLRAGSIEQQVLV